MSRPAATRLLTVLVLAGALAIIAARKQRSRPGATPQDTVYSMLDAAQKGDLNAYLVSFDGALAATLRKSLSETGAAAFIQYLKNTNAPLKGVALSDPQPLGPGEVKVRVEYIYQDRNEAQFVYLENRGSGWKISRVENSERVKTLVPYGTPVQ